MDDEVHCLGDSSIKSPSRDEAINISDVIEVIETDPDFPTPSSNPKPKASASSPSTNTASMHSNQQDPSGAGGAGGANRRQAAVRIVEQPAAKALRFRYECEGRSAGSIPGANSTPENKTFPAIRIEGYQGRAVVVVSCVTKDPPYRPHPHNLVGREGCKKGVCTLEVSPETMTVQFSNLGIQCIKKKEIEAALKVREDIRVDPFRTGFSHRSQPTSIDLNAVRLAFQVFLQNEKSRGFTHPLSPIVSDPIYDKKAMTDLNIVKLSDCNSPVDGGHKDIILLCEKVAKEDIQVRFYEEKDGAIVWEAFGDFQPSQVHKQTAIWFRTPRYRTLDITEPVRVNIQLRRPSDGATSVPLPFEMLPLDAGRPAFWSMRRNITKKGNYSLFSSILANDPQLCSAAKRKYDEMSVSNKVNSEIDNINNNIEVVHADVNHPTAITETIDITDNTGSYTPHEKVDSTLSELIREVGELDKIYEDNQKRINEIDAQTQMVPQESFDDNKTYSSLQMAFKNPVQVVDIDISDKYEDIILNPQCPVIDISNKISPPEPESDKLPPLPPKRAKKVIETYIGDDFPQENISFSNEPSTVKLCSSQILTPIPLSRTNSLNLYRPKSQSDLMAPAKKLPPTPTSTLPNPKKRGFFAKIFGKNKSKTDLHSQSGGTPPRHSIASSQSLQISTTALNRTPSNISKTTTASIRDGSKEIGEPVISNNAVINVENNENINNNNSMLFGQKLVEVENCKDLLENPELFETDDFNMNLDLTEAEHYALYTAIAPRATQSEFDETSCYYAPVEGGKLLTDAEMITRLNGNNSK